MRLDWRHQVLMFSATLHDPQIRELSEIICKFPTWVDLKGKDTVPEVRFKASRLKEKEKRECVFSVCVCVCVCVCVTKRYEKTYECVCVGEWFVLVFYANCSPHSFDSEFCCITFFEPIQTVHHAIVFADPFTDSSWRNPDKKFVTDRIHAKGITFQNMIKFFQKLK
jgi:hypothetical protein